ncbi:MAG TPA: hypothetical protein PLY66_10465 [Acidobacteriota bacterium]|nr:hypothetical protein [Acidobacteriota bacterium]HQF87746.1 hypothetical protein [Acidobacteriota bacterium]HQG92462.1 hypothetical protein [Acidobacteriota bacterium]HQK87839.1 hypothetical protein [Acidobacteriota bacterium]
MSTAIIRITGFTLLVLAAVAAQGVPAPAAPVADPAPATQETIRTDPSQTPPPGPALRPGRLEGKARLVLEKNQPPDGKRYTLPVLVDLTEVLVVGDADDKVPGVLGAYILGITFDPAKVRLVDVLGGNTPGYQKAPVFTNLEKANAEGLVRFTSYQTRADAPAGCIAVARVVLDIADSAGLETVELLADSLATSIRKGADGRTVGPFAIPFEGKALPRRTITPAKP